MPHFPLASSAAATMTVVPWRSAAGVRPCRATIHLWQFFLLRGKMVMECL
uniref:Uncharacterized protein n=1 Tax=Arundo donax TaxID=35708 RepID=A0A0A9DWD4_ARUDO